MSKQNRFQSFARPTCASMVRLTSVYILLACAGRAAAQGWAATSAPSVPWVSIASSADGSNLVAAPYRRTDNSGSGVIYSRGQIYVSTNAGATWLLTSAPGNDWRCVACSADGSVMLAGAVGSSDDSFHVQPGLVWVSTNSGSAWVPATVPIGSWWSVASSADGRRLFAGGYGNSQMLATSTNSGVTWTTVPFVALIYEWRSLACSADGNKLAAVDTGSGVIYTSTNSGVSWTLTGAPTNAWVSIAGSADGKKLVAGSANLFFGLPIESKIFLSTNGGSTWKQSSAPDGDWYDVASSADGNRLAAVGGPGTAVYTSTNAGFTWTSNNVPAAVAGIVSVAASADGNRLAAALAYTDQTFTNDSGQIDAFQSVPTPLLSITPSAGNTVLSWTVPSQNFRLQQSSNLATANWTDVSNPAPVPNLTNLQNQVALPTTNGSRFFRLIH